MRIRHLSRPLEGPRREGPSIPLHSVWQNIRVFQENAGLLSGWPPLATLYFLVPCSGGCGYVDTTPIRWGPLQEKPNAGGQTDCQKPALRLPAAPEAWRSAADCRHLMEE